MFQNVTESLWCLEDNTEHYKSQQFCSTAKGPRDTLCQLKPCCADVHRIAFEKPCNRLMTFKVIQGHWKLLNQEVIQHFLLVVCSNITINLHTKFEMSSFI